ncbi:MAG: hypothetical protein ABJN36_17385, partial [Cyclobacteriaceae bacterium]
MSFGRVPVPSLGIHIPIESGCFYGYVTKNGQKNSSSRRFHVMDGIQREHLTGSLRRSTVKKHVAA